MRLSARAVETGPSNINKQIPTSSPPLALFLSLLLYFSLSLCVHRLPSQVTSNQLLSLLAVLAVKLPAAAARGVWLLLAPCLLPRGRFL